MITANKSVLLLALLGGVASLHAYTHKIHNQTADPIQVTLDWHDMPGHIFCPRPGVVTIQPYAEGSYESGVCQLRALTVKQPVVQAPDLITAPALTHLEISNISKEMVAKVARALGSALEFASRESIQEKLDQLFESQPLIASYLTDKIPVLQKMLRDGLVYRPNVAENVAYASTSWIYHGPGQLDPISGVTIYRAAENPLSIGNDNRFDMTRAVEPSRTVPLIEYLPTNTPKVE